MINRPITDKLYIIWGCEEINGEGRGSREEDREDGEDVRGVWRWDGRGWWSGRGWR